MNGIDITPDTIVYFTIGPAQITATLVFTWAVMALLILVALLGAGERSRWRPALDIMVGYLRRQIMDITGRDDLEIISFTGTLFLFIALANVISVVPGMESPTGSLNTTAALAICVFAAVPLFGILRTGLTAYLKQYARPSVFMLPFHVIGEFSRTLALAVRLFGNMMSGKLVIAMLVSLTPLVVPVVMNLFGLLVGLLQAYIFTVLALVYIASGLRSE